MTKDERDKLIGRLAEPGLAEIRTMEAEYLAGGWGDEDPGRWWSRMSPRDVLQRAAKVSAAVVAPLVDTIADLTARLEKIERWRGRF